MKSLIWNTFWAFLVLSAQVQAADNIQGKRIALLTNTAVSPWIAKFNPTFASVLEKRGAKVVNMTSPQDPALQSQQIDDAVAQKYDLIVLNSINEIALIPALERAKQAGVPVVLSVQNLPKGNESLYVTVVGQDIALTAELAATQLLQQMGTREGNVGILQGNPAQTQTPILVDSFKRTLAKNPNMKVVAVEGKSWRTDEAGVIARQMLLRSKSQGGLQAIYAMADSQAAQVIAAIEAVGMIPGKDVLVVSAICGKEGIESIKSGKLISSVDINPSTEADIVADIVEKILKGEQVPKVIHTPSPVITKENVEQHAAACTY
jgi:ribose transport system substrate-binding protein